MDVGSLRAELELDTTQFRRDIDQAGNQFRQLGQGAETSFRGIMDAQGRLRDEQGRYIREVRDGSDAVNRAGQQQETALRGIRDANGRLRDEHGRYIREVREGANTAERAGERVGRSFREAGREADRSGSIFDGLGDRISGAMERGAGAAEGAGATGGGSFIAAFGTRIAALGSKAGPIGLALGATVGVGALFGAKLADTVYDGFQIQAQRDFAQASFGLTDTQMAVYGEAAGNAYGNAWGESVAANIDTAGIAVQAGIIDGDATAAEMQPLIEQLTFVSSIMGEEIPAVARAAGQMIKTGMVDTPTEAMDLLTAAQQRGLNLNEDILDTMNEYGTQFRKLGIDGPAAFGLIGQAVEGGARDADVAADALKEFSIRVFDTSEGSMDTLDKLGAKFGMTSDEIQVEMGKGGEAAFKMSDTLIDALRGIEDPLLRNEMGVQMFGTQWEDMGDAILGMDLSTAGDQLDAAGKAAEGMGTAGGGAASAMEAAKNRITVAADETKLKLAEAFAPTALDAATWIGEHQDEIVLFLAQTAAAAIDVTAAVIDGAGAMLQFGGMAYTAGLRLLEGFVRPITAMMEAMGGVVKHVPGMKSIGEAMEDTAKKTNGMIDGMKSGAEGMGKAGGAMFTLADKIRDGSATLDDFILAQQQSIQETGTLEAQVTNLGDTLNALPRDKPIDITAPGGVGVKDLLTELGVKVNTDNNKNVVVESPLAPEVIAILDQLGIKVRTDNNKSILVTSTAPGVKVDIDNLKTAIDNLPQTRAIDVITSFYSTGTPPPRTGTNNGAVDGVLGAFPNADGPPRANGGPVRGFGGPKQDNILTPTSNGEWVIQAAAVDYYGEEFMAMVNAGMLGKPRADGGPITVLDSLQGVQRKVAPALKMTSGQRDEPGSYHNTGQAGDFSNGSSNTDEMLAFANYMADNYRGQLAELIYHDPRFSGRQVGDGQFVPDSYYAGAGDHTNHVHVAANEPLPNLDPAASNGGDIRTAKQKNIDVVIAEGQRRGESEAEIRSAVMAVLAETGGENLDHGMDGDNAGILQQRPSWGTVEQRMDPAYAANAYYDALNEIDQTGLSEAQMAQAVQQSGTADGSNYAAKQAEADAEIAASAARSSATSSPATGAGATGVQNVYVVGGKLDGATPSSASSTPSTPAPADEAEVFGKGPLPFVAYANGGTIPGVGNEDSELILGMPGEEIISKGPAAEWRPLLKAINSGKLKKFAMGGTVGFGGYSDDMTDAMKPQNWYDWASLAVGGTMTAASMVMPYVNMAMGGKVDLGSMTPNINTGANSIDVTGMISEALTPIQKQLEELTTAVVHSGKTLHMVDRGTGAADMLGMKVGR